MKYLLISIIIIFTLNGYSQSFVNLYPSLSPLISIVNYQNGTTQSTCGDYDNDGDMDILFVGKSIVTPNPVVCKIFKNMGNGGFMMHSIALSLQILMQV